MSGCARKPAGFTLIEVLVVVAIIALLISILLPSLRAAKQQANTVACGSNQRQIMMGANQYMTESRGYYPGPNTSGVGLHRGQAYAGAQISPVQDWDFISPAIGRMAGLPRGKTEAVRLLKFQRLLMTDLTCPENKFKYQRRFTGPALPMSGHPNVTSYMTPAYMHLKESTQNSSQWEVIPTGEAISLPGGARQQIDAIKTPARKVYAFEGGRYLDTSVGPMALDYSTVTNTSGLVGTPQGNFTSRGPGFTGAQGEPYMRDAGGQPTAIYKLVSLRHKNKANVIFFDGHFESLFDRDLSKPQYYAPTGSIIQNQNAIALNTPAFGAKWKNGMVLP